MMYSRDVTNIQGSISQRHFSQSSRTRHDKTVVTGTPAARVDVYVVVMVTKGAGLHEVAHLVQLYFNPTDLCIVGHTHTTVAVAFRHGDYASTISAMTIRDIPIVLVRSGIIVVMN